LHTECLLQNADKSTRKRGVYKAAARHAAVLGKWWPGTEVCACVFGAGGKRQCMHMHKEDRLPKQKTEQNTLGERKAVGLQFTEQKEMCARSCGVLGRKRREGVGRGAAAAEAYIQKHR